MGHKGKLLVGQLAPVDEIAEKVLVAGRQIVLRTSREAVSRFSGQARRQSGRRS